MDKIFKVNSIETNDLNENQNLLNFEIPSSEMLDLSKSYMSVRVKPNASLTAGGAGGIATADAVFNTDLRFNNNSISAVLKNSYVPTVSLIKNASLSSSNAGRVEELRDVNILRMHQQAREKNEKELQKNSIFNFQGCRNQEAFGHVSPLIQATCEDQTPNQGAASKTLDKEVRIPLKDILNVCSTNMFDTQRLGRCRFSVELDLSRFSASSNNNIIEYYTTNNNGKVDANAAAGDKTQLTLSKVYNVDFKEHLPYYVGMPVKGLGTVAGVSIAAVYNTITNITQDLTGGVNNGKVTLTFKNSWGNGAVSADVKILPVLDAEITSSFTMNQAQLTLHALSKDKIKSRPDKYEYSVYDLERDNGNGRANFTKNYEILPNAFNMLVLTPGVNTGKFSNMTYQNYRVAVDGVLLTNRNIPSKSDLDFDRLRRYYENNGKVLRNTLNKNLDRINGQVGNVNNFRSSYTGSINALSSINEPLPVTNKLKMVELEINTNTAGGMKDILIYTEKMKTI